MELDHYVTYTTYDLIGELTFSRPFGFIEAGRDIGASLAQIRGVQAIVSTVGWFEWIHSLLTNPLVTWLGVLPLGIIFAHCMSAITERERNSDARFDMVGQWLDTIHRHPDRTTRRDLEAQVMLNVGAGAETVSGTFRRNKGEGGGGGGCPARNVLSVRPDATFLIWLTVCPLPFLCALSSCHPNRHLPHDPDAGHLGARPGRD